MKTLVKRGTSTPKAKTLSASALVNAMHSPKPKGRTANGAVTHESSGDALVDMFALAGAFRSKALSDDSSVIELFKEALEQDKIIALKILFWARDIRGGAGERRFFQICWNWFSNNFREDAIQLLPLLPFYGRWKDVWESTSDSMDEQVIALVSEALDKEDGLCAKWLPRKGAMAKFFSNALGLSSRDYRKKIVSLSKTVEQQMCAGNFSEIDYSHVPSVAFTKYYKAFYKRDTERFEAFVKSAEKGVSKINAGAIYPHDIVAKVKNSSGNNAALDAQWKNLPDFIEEGKSIMPIVDVSGSMSMHISGKTTAMDISIALGIYCAERNKSIFKGSMITFHSKPSIVTINPDDSVSRNVQLVRRMPWGMSTNLQAAMELILSSALEHGLDDSDIPDYLLVLSDMEFNHCGSGTNLASIRAKFKQSGYAMPKIVFWNLNGRKNNQPATAKSKDVALVSGFSPSIMKSVLSAKTVTPFDVMLNTISSERYDLVRLD